MGLTQFSQKPFTPTRLEEERAEDKRVVLSVSLSQEEYSNLKEDMLFLGQVKDSTALKQVWEAGRIVIHNPFVRLILDTLNRNFTNNMRKGIRDPTIEINANVGQKLKDL